MSVVIVLRNLLLVVFMGMLSVTAVAANDAHAKTILIVGDSISAGFGIPLQQGWVALLGKELQRLGHNTQVMNASISGDTTQGGVSRLPALLESHQPHLVVIELGGNDGLRGTPIRRIQANLQRMIHQAREANSDIFLVGMQIPPNYGRKYTQSFREIFPTLAEENQIPYLPFLLDNVVTEPGMMQADGIHPTATAQPQMMQNVLPGVLQWLTK